MSTKLEFAFTATAWKYPAAAGWHFVTVPVAIGAEIRENSQWQEEGWGRLKAVAQIGNTKWETAIWFDTKHGTYLLPLKAEIRKKEKILVGKELSCCIWI